MYSIKWGYKQLKYLFPLEYRWRNLLLSSQHTDNMEIAQAHSKHQRLEERNIEGDIWHKHQWNPSSLWCVRLDKICQLKLTLCHLSNVCAYTCMCVFSMKSLKTNGYGTTDLTRRVRSDIPLPSTIPFFYRHSRVFHICNYVCQT